ncbi:glycosyl hydrolase [Capsulimonas corticalis]|uniref:Glycosyl hydrolase n=1 Tax=Capsulimonas corticalis TaxID=2219043 RepID=A0A402D1B7_9BACT|nr:alpha-amylase family glycosyl hydrolase [Capsulimonas corticalis]BDI31653.1 glycosyl hydrolase [Capsulimonas corticalis]
MHSNYLFSRIGVGAAILLASSVAGGHAADAQGNAPAVDRVEPPSWWAGSTMNPVRVLLHGKNLAGAKVTAGGGVSARSVKVNGNGDYVFVDLAIDKDADPGAKSLKVTTPDGTATAAFEVTAPLPAAGRFQGFSPDDVIYQIMPDRFSDGDAANNDPAIAKGLYGRSNPHLYHGGDFQGIIQHLPYLKDLGVTAIWITPVYENVHHVNTLQADGTAPYSDYHGYGAINQYGVEQHFGDLAGMRELVDRAHAIGVKVIQDQVANHVGPYHAWAKDPPTPTWFTGTAKSHGNNTYQIWTVMDPHGAPDESAATLGGWFANVLPDLNQNDPEVARYEIQNALWWVGMTGLDGIRQDTMPYVPRAFWTQWSTAITRQYPHVNAVGEVFDGDSSLVSYFQGGRKGPDGVDTKMDSLFDYPLYFPLRRTFAQGGSFHDLAVDEAHDWLFPHADHLVTFLGNHDVKRFSSEDGATPAGLSLAQTFLMTNRGIPLVYYGDELGMKGGDDPDNRQDFPGGFPGDPRSAFTEAGRTPQEQEIWSHLRKLAHLRADLAPLRRGSQMTLTQTDKQWAYARTLGGDTVIVALNNDTNPATFTIPVGATNLSNGVTLTDRLGAVGAVTVKDGGLAVTLPARTGAVFVK